ncbi:bifunctional diaminohydroxyphosphoribosylaminopyrimidine deaminase/5-amino-6-(5-phosphoribosylamino)uracil reductase RibD [Bacillus infantis]|uniref:bifunctional diaminohydroxyphosphoribosylaminopyrimidine deaminase/5-amino-6-(5-phosphoribosylamino)uracil reductase RibD n=1 Tax=Bacillus infantis TaxID=324767 RepID=UPI003CEEAB1E
MTDEDYMDLALSLARKTIGQTSPNPCVGAVVVKDGQIAGMGAHLKAGTPHAEVHAIRMADALARGAEIYVTLEPCSHHGKTPPCADLIIESGIKRVVIASIDPNPVVAGRGIAKLQAAGIEVAVGIRREEAEEINSAFFHFMRTSRPYVTIKAAASFDGKTAAKTGDSQWITSPESREDVHRLRHEHDAILTGVNTVIHDNPQLTARLPRGGKNPIRVILDSTLRIPDDASILHDQKAPVIIFTGSSYDKSKAEKIKALGTELVHLSEEEVSAGQVLEELAKRQVLSVFVEGGSEIHASFIKGGLFQQIILYAAPKIIGGRKAVPFVGGEGISSMDQAVPLAFKSAERIGPDLKITAVPQPEEGQHVHRIN